MFNIDNRPSLFVFSPYMSVLFWRVDQEGSHNTSMAASHVDHVVRFSVFHVSQVSSLVSRCSQFAFSFPFGETKDVCFFGVFLNIVLSAE